MRITNRFRKIWSGCARMKVGGKPLEIITLPMPGKIVREDQRLAGQLCEFLHRE